MSFVSLGHPDVIQRRHPGSSTTQNLLLLSTFWSILQSGKQSFGQTLFKWVKFMHICHFPFGFFIMVTLANHVWKSLLLMNCTFIQAAYDSVSHLLNWLLAYLFHMFVPSILKKTTRTCLFDQLLNLLSRKDGVMWIIPMLIMKLEKLATISRMHCKPDQLWFSNNWPLSLMSINFFDKGQSMALPWFFQTSMDPAQSFSGLH